MMKRLIAYSVLLCATAAFSQETGKGIKDKPEKLKADKYLPEGNEQFAEKKYKEAEANYRISESNTGSKSEAAYNLGNAIYRQDQAGEAGFAYLRAAQNTTDKKEKHKAFHNLGNVLMKQKDYKDAVEAYKNALRNDPYDDETRYNYALAKKMLKDNPPPPPKKDDKKDKDKNKDKDKDKNQGGGNNNDKNQSPKDQGDKKDKGSKGDQKNKGDKGDEQGKNGQDEKQKDNPDGQGKQDKGKGNDGDQPKPASMSPSKQRMENLLNAMNNEEKKVQDKINAQKVKVQPQKNEKDW